MKTRILLTGIVFAAACFAESGMELYQKAVTQERAGKMDDAIRLYEKVAHDFASDRALAAKALVAAARDYEKLGEDNAVKLYERVAREYGDQRESAATANARLAALRRQAAPVTMTQRKIEPPIDGLPGYYTDGQRAVYRDAAANALTIGDLDGRNKRVFFKLKPGESLAFHPSRDLSMVWLRVVASSGQVTHAVIRIDGTGYRELFQGYPYGASLPDWSWDNRYLLFGGVPPGLAEGPFAITESGTLVIGGGVVVVSVSDGKSREVVRRDGSVVRAAFSPDGRFIAFSESRGLGPNIATKTFLMPVQGGEPRLVSDDATLMDWTPDGRYLAASSQRSGAQALYLLPVKDGQPSGNPVFVRYSTHRCGTH